MTYTWVIEVEYKTGGVLGETIGVIQMPRKPSPKRLLSLWRIDKRAQPEHMIHRIHAYKVPMFRA